MKTPNVALKVLYSDQWVGLIDFSIQNEPTFKYTDSWLENKYRFPISFSMPLGQNEFKHPLCFNFFDNLLPEGNLRNFFAEAKQTSPKNLFQLLKSLNSDLPGALELRPENDTISVDGYEKFGNDKETEPTIRSSVPITFPKLDSLLNEESSIYEQLVETQGAEFSIAGLQDKFTCQFCPFVDEVLLVFGQEPSTHIVKVNPKWRNNQVVSNEYFCLSLAQKVGLPIPKIYLRNTQSETNPVLILERFDRILDANGRPIGRVHQEDMCQSFGLNSMLKYENDGGKSFVEVYKHIRSISSNPIIELGLLLDWLCFNLIIGNNDSHLKNLSVLIGPNEVRLSPFYDLVSTEIYGNKFRRRFAISIGGTFEFDKIQMSNLGTLEVEIGLKTGSLASRLATLKEKVNDAISITTSILLSHLPNSTVPHRISEVIKKRSKHIDRFL